MHKGLLHNTKARHYTKKIKSENGDSNDLSENDHIFNVTRQYRLHLHGRT